MNLRRDLTSHGNMTSGMPPRSRLYCLAPLEMETVEGESFTSYVTRLAGIYRVSPRDLISLEIIPNLKRTFLFHRNFEKLGSYCRRGAMTINGAGETTSDWVDVVERLTMRNGLRILTLQPWAHAFPSRGLLRSAPSWCPTCYQERQEKGQPIYQPLQWMLQIVVICVRHKRWLEEVCPFCLQFQSVIALKTQPGYCTQCAAWLGRFVDPEEPKSVDDETFLWQEWVRASLQELRHASILVDALPWERLFIGLDTCIEVAGGARAFAKLVDMSQDLLNQWLRNKAIPTFNRLLEVCYVVDLSPLQLLMADPDVLENRIRSTERHHLPRPHRPLPRRVSRDDALTLIHDVLEGREALLPVFEIERRLGLTSRTLRNRFPKECLLITALYRRHIHEQSIQKIQKKCDEVREIMLSLHAQGIYPSSYLVEQLHSDPHIIRKPFGKATWDIVLSELGLAKGYKKKAKRFPIGR